MIGFEQILVPLKNSQQSQCALTHAAMLASGTEASIVALHLATLNGAGRAVTENFSSELLKIQDKYPNIKKISVRTLGQTKAIHKHIVEYAQENTIDCIVMKNGDVSGLDSFENESVKEIAYNVGLESECPVFTFTQSPESPHLKNILLPLDLSHGSLYKVPVALGLARQYRAKIHLLSASEHREDHQEIKQQMDEVREELRREGISIHENDVLQETLSDAIAQYCDRNSIDLIVIMSRPAFRWADEWMSPSARKIMTQSKVPVLSLRTDQLLH